MPHSHQGNQILNPLMSDGDETYQARILSYSPIAYWPLNETSGTAAICVVNALQNGTYARDVSVMGTQDGIGDGNTAPTFDGLVDEVGIFSAALAAAMNTASYSYMIWVRLSGAGIWTDGAIHVDHCFQANVNNRDLSAKWAQNNRFLSYRRGGGAFSYCFADGQAWLDWRCVIHTVNQATTTQALYIATVPYIQDVPTTPWGSAMAAATLGSQLGASFWSGGLAHAAIFNGILSAAQIADLSTV